MKNKEDKIVAMAEKLYVKKYCNWEFVESVNDENNITWDNKSETEYCYDLAKDFYEEIEKLLKGEELQI